MCGISFLQTTEAVSHEDLLQMQHSLRLLHHRGPDGHGIRHYEHMLLGHCRLAIMDKQNAQILSHGPFHEDEFNLDLSFNGEIVNYLELKKELEKLGYLFKTNSDIEVVAKAWGAWGPDSLSKFEGMFTFVMHDNRKNHTIVARDQLGIKPLYFSTISGKTLFASEIKAFGAFIALEINQECLEEYLLFGYISSPRTFLKNIQQFPKSHYAILDLQQKMVLNSFSYQAPYDAYSVSFSETLKTRTSGYLKSDRGISLLLSGGLDSSYLAFVMSKTLPAIECTSFGVKLDDPNHDESPFQEITAKTFGIKHHAIPMGAKELIDNLFACSFSMDQPIFHLSSILLHVLYKNIGNFAKATITGEGADELFAGYDRYSFSTQLLKDKLHKGIPPNASVREVLQCLYPYLRRLYLSPQRLTLLAPEVFNKNVDIGSRSKFFNPDSFSLDRIYEHDQQYHLEALLTRQDRMSCLASVESRVPFCDQFLWQKWQNIPLSEKLLPHGTKSMLKATMFSHLPESFVMRKKKGFGLPVHAWLTQYPFSQSLDLLHSRVASERGIFNKKALDFELLRLKEKDYASSQYILRLILFEAWAQSGFLK